MNALKLYLNVGYLLYFGHLFWDINLNCWWHFCIYANKFVVYKYKQKVRYGPLLSNDAVNIEQLIK